jgi:hypothetical protein
VEVPFVVCRLADTEAPKVIAAAQAKTITLNVIPLLRVTARRRSGFGYEYVFGKV